MSRTPEQKAKHAAEERDRRAGRTSEQKEARNEYTRAWRASRTREQKEVRNAHMRAYQKQFRLLHPEKIRAQNRRRYYGLSPAVFEELRQKQEGKCAVCSNALVTGRGTQVDHCHSTGKVRGLVCQGCNLVLGFSEDNPETLRSAIEYLERHALNSKGLGP